MRKLRSLIARASSVDKLRFRAYSDVLANRLDDAVYILESAKQRDAKAWSDLSALYLQRAQEKREPHDFVLALAAAEEAIAQDPTLMEARFNRAVAFERIGMAWQARKAWSEYIGKESAAEWRREAEWRLIQLRKPPSELLWREALNRLERAAESEDWSEVDGIVHRFRLRSRRFAEEELLARWAYHRKPDPGRAENYLRLAEKIGAALEARTGDRMLLDAIARIRESGNPQDLIEGHLAYRDGVRFYEGHQVDKAWESLLVAQARLSRAGSPIAFWASFFAAGCEYQRNRYTEASYLLDTIERAADAGLYPSLNGRILWMRGLMLLVQSHYESALKDYLRALGVFQKTGEIEHVAAIRLLLFEYHYLTGETGPAWRQLREALSQVDEIGDSRLRQVILWLTATALDDDYPRLAVYVQDRLVRLALSSKNPVAVVEALRLRAAVHYRCGHMRDAVLDLEQSTLFAQRIESGPLREGLLGNILLTQGMIQRASPDKSLRSFARAVSIFQETDYRLELLQAYFEMARASRQIGDFERARSSLASGLTELERQRQFVAPPQRVAFWEQAQNLFGEMVSLEIDAHKRYDLAFDYAERAKARELLDLVTEGRYRVGLSSRPVTLVELRERLPLGVTLIEFALLNDRFIVWAVRRDGWEVQLRDVSAGEMSVRIGAFRRAVQRGDQRLPTIAGDLYRDVFGGLSPQILASPALVFIPDKSLSRLPLGALQNPETGRYLVQDYRIEVAPSATIYLDRLDSFRRRPISAEPRLLMVANPSFDPHLFPELKSLSAVDREVKGVAGLFLNNEMLIGSEATKNALLSRARSAEILHVASHALANNRSLISARIVLAHDPLRPDSGVLSADEIESLRLEDLRLVFLSVCKGAEGAEAGVEGVVSLARSFLVAGAVAVVASLWSVEDDTSAQIAVEFYRELSAGASPADALRSAQLKLLEGEDERSRAPAAWAAFNLFGAGAGVVE